MNPGDREEDPTAQVELRGSGADGGWDDADRSLDAPDGYEDEYTVDHDDYVDDYEDDEFVYLPAESSRARKFAYVVGGFLLCIALIGAAGGWWLMRQVNPGNPGVEVSLTIPPGSTNSQIATLLVERGIVTNATVFQFYTKWRNAGPYKAGRYDGLRRNSSMSDVVKRLEAGPLPPEFTEFRVREGSWVQETRDAILAAFPQMNAAELDQALQTVRSRYEPDGSVNLEGLLFPATYRVEEGRESDEQQLVQQMVSTFDELGAEIGLDDATEKLDGVAGTREITPYDVVIVASMIESEAKIPEDRAKIARVIYNRLKAGEKLGIDATVIYALGHRTEELTATDLKIDSPFNTRLNPGMPPTPIGSPSKESLLAALNPEEGTWMYYVIADEDGGHYFTDNYNDFLRAQNEARKKGLL